MLPVIVLTLLLPLAAFAQTIPQPLWVTHIYDITSADQVQDMRSNTRQCNMFTFSVTSGTGNWNVQLEYATSAAQLSGVKVNPITRSVVVPAPDREPTRP